MSDPNKKTEDDVKDNVSDTSDYHYVEPYVKTPSPPAIPTPVPSIKLANSQTTSASTTSSVSSRLGHLETQKKIHADARQSQAARNSVTSIVAASTASNKTDRPISNKPDDDDESNDEEEEVERVLDAEMVSDEELSARDLEAVVGSSYFDLFFMTPLLLLPSFLVYFLTSVDVYNIITMKDPAGMSTAMEFIRYNVFAAVAYGFYIVFDVLSLAIPEAFLLFTPASKNNSKTQKFIRGQIQMVINIRKNFALSTWLITLIIVGSFLLYNSIFTSPRDLIRKLIAGEEAKLAGEAAADTEKLGKLIAEGKNMIIQKYIETFLVLMAVFSTVLALEKYMIQMIRLGFHKKAFADRIGDSNRHFGYLLKLYEAVKFGKPRVLSSSSVSLLDIDSTVDLKADNALNLTSVHRAKSVSRLIFRTLLPANSGRDYLLVEDFEKFTALSKEAFDCFDLDLSGKLMEKELEEAIVDIYFIRHNLIRGLKSNGKIVKKLDILLLVVSFILAGLLSSPIFDIGVGNLLGFLGVLSTGFGFLFHSTAKSCFEAILFVFIQHTFDVGDRVIIDNENFVVEDIEVFTTKMTRWDGVVVYIANSALCSKVIQNIRRSENQWESLTVKVVGENPTESFWNFRQELEKELKVDEGFFTGEVELANLDDLPSKGEALSVTVLAQAHGNFQNSAKRNARKANLLEIVETALKNSNLTKA